MMANGKTVHVREWQPKPGSSPGPHRGGGAMQQVDVKEKVQPDRKIRGGPDSADEAIRTGKSNYAVGRVEDTVERAATAVGAKIGDAVSSFAGSLGGWHSRGGASDSTAPSPSSWHDRSPATAPTTPAPNWQASGDAVK